MRNRFYYMAPGQVDSRHSHDLGHEIFFILQGQCEMEVEGERAVLGPGQACIARRDELHQAKNVGDGPVIMYLSVTPHIEPTHTQWTADPKEGGEKLRPRYGDTRRREGIPDSTATIPELIDRHVETLRGVAALAQFSADAHARLADDLKHALTAGDQTASRDTVDALWAQLYPMFRAMSDLTEIWNELAPRATAAGK